MKLLTGTRKERLSGKGRRQRRGPAEAFGVSKSQQEFAKTVSDALPLQAVGDVTASAADPYENWCWWILYCLLVLRVLLVLWVDRRIDRAVSIIRAAYNASFGKC